MKMKFVKKSIALCAAALAACMLLTSCSGRREETGVAYEKKMVIESVADLEGKAVAVQLRSAADEYVVDNNITAYPKRYENLEDAAQDLVDKKVAAIVADAYYASTLCEQYEGLEIVTDSMTGAIEYRFAALKENGGDALMAKFDEALETGIGTATLQKNMIDTEMRGAQHGHVDVTPADGQELDGTATFVTDPYFKPFVYQENGDIVGLFPTVAKAVAYNSGMNYAVKSVEGDTLGALEGEESAFTVISGELSKDDAENYAVSEMFYTSCLVIVKRSSEK